MCTVVRRSQPLGERRAYRGEGGTHRSPNPALPSLKASLANATRTLGMEGERGRPGGEMVRPGRPRLGCGPQPRASVTVSGAWHFDVYTAMDGASQRPGQRNDVR